MFYRLVIDILRGRITSMERVPCFGLLGLLELDTVRDVERDALHDVKIDRFIAARFVFRCKVVRLE